MNALTKPSQGLIPHNMHEAVQLAELMARGKMLPQHLQNTGDSLMIVEQAMRWNMSPFALAQNTFNIKGKLLYAGAAVHAAIEGIGAISGLINYTFKGEGLERTVTVSATRKGETEPKTVEVKLKDTITENQQWKKQPDQQLCYHAVRVWARRWTPGVLLGVHTIEEWQDQPKEIFAGPTIDAEPTPLSSAEIIGDAIPERVMEPPKPKGPTIRQYLDKLHDTLSACHTEWEVDAVAQSEDVTKAVASFKGQALDDLNALLAEALERVRQNEDAADEPVPADDGEPATS